MLYLCPPTLTHDDGYWACALSAPAGIGQASGAVLSAMSCGLWMGCPY